MWQAPPRRRGAHVAAMWGTRRRSPRRWWTTRWSFRNGGTCLRGPRNWFPAASGTAGPPREPRRRSLGGCGCACAAPGLEERRQQTPIGLLLLQCGVAHHAPASVEGSFSLAVVYMTVGAVVSRRVYAQQHTHTMSIYDKNRRTL